METVRKTLSAKDRKISKDLAGIFNDICIAECFEDDEMIRKFDQRLAKLSAQMDKL